MAEFASKGVAGAGLGLGIAGTALGLLSGGIPTMYGQVPICQHDLVAAEQLAAKDSEIARLNAKAYSDESDLAVYKYFIGEIQALKNELGVKFTEQAVINAKVDTGLSTLSGQINGISTTVNNITKTAIPTNAICNFGCNNCGCNQI